MARREPTQPVDFLRDVAMEEEVTKPNAMMPSAGRVWAAAATLPQVQRQHPGHWQPRQGIQRAALPGHQRMHCLVFNLHSAEDRYAFHKQVRPVSSRRRQRLAAVNAAKDGRTAHSHPPRWRHPQAHSAEDRIRI